MDALEEDEVVVHIKRGLEEAQAQTQRRVVRKVVKNLAETVKKPTRDVFDGKSTSDGSWNTEANMDTLDDHYRAKLAAHLPD